MLLGILLACKVSFATLLYLPAVPVLWALQPVRRGRFIIAGAGALAAGAFLGAPYACLHPKLWWSGVEALRRDYARAYWPYASFPDGNCFGMLGRYFPETCGLGVLLLAIVGVVALVRAKRLDALALLIAPMLVFAVLFGLQRAFFERNLSPLASLYAIAAAIGLAALWQRARLPHPARSTATALVALACLAVPLRWSWIIVHKVFDRSSRSERAAYEERLAAPYGGMEIVSKELFFGDAVADLRRHWVANSEGFILRAEDFNDAISRHRAALIQKTYFAKLLASPPHPLEGLSVNTLWSHLPRLSYYLVPPHTRPVAHVEAVSLEGWRMSPAWRPATDALPAYVRAEYAFECRGGSGTAQIISPPIHLCQGDVLAGYALHGPDWKAIQAGLDTDGDGLMDKSFGALGAGWQRWAFESEKEMTVRLLVADFEVSRERWLILAQPAVYSSGRCAGGSPLSAGSRR